MTRGQLFYDLSLAQLESDFKASDLPAYRVRQLWEGIYAHLLPSPYAITNLPKDLRQEIDERYVFDAFEIRDAIDSTDGGTEKLLLELQDGARI